MKANFVFLLLILSFKVFSQNVEKSIILKDSETNLPIEDATVYVVKTKQTLLSNSEGTVDFILNGVSNIQITHSSYSRVLVRSSTLKEDKNVILLKKNMTELDEIVVTKQHPQKILKSLVSNSIKKLTVPARLKVYSREIFKLNGKYSYYNDGLMNFQLFGNDRNFKSNILVEQNRSFGLIDGEDLTQDLLGYNLNDIMENYYNFKYLNPILEKKAKNEYDFIIKVYSANNDYNVILVTPAEGFKGLHDDFRIIYDYKNKVIIETSSVISPTSIANSKDKKYVGAKNIYKSLFKTIYRFDDENYYLVSSKEEIGFEKVGKKKTNDIEVRNCFVTTNFSNVNYSYKESEVFKDKTLYNKKNVILSKYWDISGLTATDEEQEIINKLEEKSF